MCNMCVHIFFMLVTLLSKNYDASAVNIYSISSVSTRGDIYVYN